MKMRFLPCEGPADAGTCGKPTRYEREVNGATMRLCDAHNHQCWRAEKAGNAVSLRPLKPRGKVRNVPKCEGPGPRGGEGTCACPAWNVGADGKRLCDAHKKQEKRHGVVWPVGGKKPEDA